MRSARTVALRESRLLLLRAVFEMGFSSPSTLFTLGSACLELGLLGEAVQHLRRAAEAQRALSLRARTAPVQDGTIYVRTATRQNCQLTLVHSTI